MSACGQGIARAALEGALDQIARAGGGLVEAIPEVTADREAQSRFLFSAIGSVSGSWDATPSSNRVCRPPLCTHSGDQGTRFAEFPVMCHPQCTSGDIVPQTYLADGGGGWTFDPTGSEKTADT